MIGMIQAIKLRFTPLPGYGLRWRKNDLLVLGLYSVSDNNCFIPGILKNNVSENNRVSTPQLFQHRIQIQSTAICFQARGQVLPVSQLIVLYSHKKRFERSVGMTRCGSSNLPHFLLHAFVPTKSSSLNFTSSRSGTLADSLTLDYDGAKRTVRTIQTAQTTPGV